LADKDPGKKGDTKKVGVMPTPSDKTNPSGSPKKNENNKSHSKGKDKKDKG
jgi:hypothetical protein